jgi:hypothetical protein
MLGACYIVDAGAVDAWEGKSGCVAGWTSGGWRFISPAEGMSLYDRGGGTWTTFRNGAWETGALRGASVLINDEQVVGARASAIPSPTGGTVADAEGRDAINAILSALRQHGLIET